MTCIPPLALLAQGAGGESRDHHMNHTSNIDTDRAAYLATLPATQAEGGAR